MVKKCIKKILVLYKISAFQHFQNRQYFPKYLSKNSRIVNRFEQTHRNHYQALAKIEKALKSCRVRYHKLRRGRNSNFSTYDLIITVGGDGTFLEASRKIKNQLIWGVNSDPQWSIGQFCVSTPETFPKVLERIMTNNFTVQPINRLRILLNGIIYPINILNDLLVCHKNPAAMSHYYLTINSCREEQKSSGIWISTAAGSSGAIHSAGGKILAMTSDKIQYMPRELYQKNKNSCRASGGIISGTKNIKITSMMSAGVIYLDGAHVKVPFPFGTKLLITKSPYPLRMVKL